MTIKLHSTSPILNQSEQDKIFDDFMDNPQLVSTEIIAGKYPLNIKTSANSTLLHYAVMLGQFELASFLIKKGFRDSINNLNLSVFDCFFIKTEFWIKINQNGNNDNAFIAFLTEYKNLVKENSITLNWEMLLSYKDYEFDSKLDFKNYKNALNLYKKLVEQNLVNPNDNELLNATKENCPQFLKAYCTHFKINDSDLLINALKQKELVNTLWSINNNELNENAEQIEQEKKQNEYYQLALNLIEQSIEQNLISGEIRKKYKLILEKKPKREFGIEPESDILECILDALIKKKDIDLFSFLKPKLSKENEIWLSEIKQLCEKYHFKSFSVEKAYLKQYYIKSLKTAFEAMINYFGIEENNIGFADLSWRCRNISSTYNKKPVQGYYHDERKVIEICTENGLNESTFVHEYTHYLQYKLGNEKIAPHLNNLMKVMKDTNNEMNLENWTEFLIKSVKNYIKKDSLEKLHDLILARLNEIHLNYTSNEEKLKKEAMFEIEFKSFFKTYMHQTLPNKNTTIALLYDNITTTMQAIKNKEKLEDGVEVDLFQKEDKKQNIIDNLKYKRQYWAKRIEIHARLNEQHFEQKKYPQRQSSSFSEQVMKNLTPSLEKFNQLLIENAKLYFNEKNVSEKTKLKV